ncbi:formylglycine-generating enzyme family protein [Sorangium sp. So ce1389]|uniref:formylglycine-generating enzyme family protein n=1 Tax=Sorangium sp. So ce1389 TaxID=3133336 RepID=UPI003F5E7556
MIRSVDVMWLGAVWALLTGGCTALAGLDREYFVVGVETTGAGGGGGGEGGAGGEAGAGGGEQIRPSCRDLPANCGRLESEDCCAAERVPAGSFNRSDVLENPYPAAVSDFSLDRFEVTVGRFRAFVDAYPDSRPASGAGAHPALAGSGWDPAWDGELPADRAGLIASLDCSEEFAMETWTDSAGANETRPINCLSWFMAFAFCAWDGGRLPTEAEWSYASAGGDEQRVYPWSEPPDDTTLNVQRASYACLADGVSGCRFADILPVGWTSPLGDGKWHQADMGGNVWEWVLDWSDAYPEPCDNCAQLTPTTKRVFRGGAWDVHTGALRTYSRGGDDPKVRWYNQGVRCARTP